MTLLSFSWQRPIKSKQGLFWLVGSAASPHSKEAAAENVHRRACVSPFFAKHAPPLLLWSLEDVGEEERPQGLDAALLQKDPLPHHRLHDGGGGLEEQIVHLAGLWWREKWRR